MTTHAAVSIAEKNEHLNKNNKQPISQSSQDKQVANKNDFDDMNNKIEIMASNIKKKPDSTNHQYEVYDECDREVSSKNPFEKEINPFEFLDNNEKTTPFPNQHESSTDPTRLDSPQSYHEFKF